MKKIGALIALITLVAVGGIYFYSNTVQESQVSSSQEELDSEVAGPSRLFIPSLGIDANVEYVGLDSKNRMDVPKEVQNVAWYQLGSKPGDKGSAVMAGHLDDPNGDPAVFWNLATIAENDEIQVIGENGEVQIFEVKRIASYPVVDFPIQEVFNDSSGRKLNLITCEGNWDTDMGTYDQRTVVYSEIKAE